MQTQKTPVLDLAAHPLTELREFAAPARVNLLGEHTDYTGGLVMPMAISFATIARVTPRTDGQYHFSSEQFEGELTLAREDRSTATGMWHDYPVGVLRQLQERGVTPPGFDLHLRGDVPFGAGLSSSASVEVASALAMLWLARETLPPEEIALLCQRAENLYVNSPCGIMDQSVITMAEAGNALLLDTRTLACEQVPMNHGGLAATRVVVCNSMVKHSIASGEYGNRRNEAEAGQAVIRSAYPEVRDLGEATLEQLNACAATMSPAAYLRCRHIVTENMRVREARLAMLAGDPVRMGALMLAAHASQRDDFACSCAEIDFLVDIAAMLPGCYGARMTGGGFGGCTVNLVAREHVDCFVSRLKSAYLEQFNIHAEIYVCEAVDGAVRRNAPKMS